MSDRELVIGNSVHTMRDPAFIAGLTNTFDETKAALEIIQNLPKRRLVVKTGSTILIITCNKKADLVFTWQTSNVINFPSTDITDIASASQVDGVDLVTITNTVASGKSNFEISRIGNRFLKQYIRCKVDYAYGGEESFTDATCDTTDTSVIIACDASATIAIGQYVSGTGIPVGSKVETVSFAITTISDTTPTPSAAWQASQSHSAFAQTSTSGSGTGATFSVVTDGAGNPTFTLVVTGIVGYQIGDTLVFTDPGSTSNTATVTVSVVTTTVKSFTITTAATATNANTTLTFHGETAASNPCLIRLTEGDDPSINDNVKDVLPIHKDRG
jgi:hypothetical protein